LYPFISLVFSFDLKRSGDTALFKFCNRHIGKLANFQDIEMGLTIFERESFVFICIFFTSICTSKGSEIQRFQNFRNVLRGKVGHFKRYRNGTNGIRKKIICTRLYLKEFGDTVYFLLREKIWNCFFYFHFYTENSFLCKIVFIFL